MGSDRPPADGPSAGGDPSGRQSAEAHGHGGPPRAPSPPGDGHPAFKGTFFLGDYRVIGEIGRGGMARVYLARLDRAGGFFKWVAIKRMRPLFDADDHALRMFLDEARIAASISHPHVAQVFELGEHESTYWIAMEYLHGEPLGEVFRVCSDQKTPLSIEFAARLIADAAEGLHAAHELRDKDGKPLELVHRDVSPQNIFLTYDGLVKLVDFGVARVANRLATTQDGMLKGKIPYMSPQQVKGQPIDRRADVFALGVVLWELVTGERLFRRDEVAETVLLVGTCEVPAPSRFRPIPEELETIILRALEKEPSDRFATARELNRALSQFLANQKAFIGPDELGALMVSLFSDHIGARNAYLEWASEVTQTIHLPQPGHPFLSSNDGLSSRSIPDFPESTASFCASQHGSIEVDVAEHQSAAIEVDVAEHQSAAIEVDHTLTEHQSSEVVAVVRENDDKPRIETEDVETVQMALSDDAPPQSQGSDRRVHQRNLACFPARVSTTHGEIQSALIRDLSVSGVALLVKEPIDVGGQVRLSLFISQDTNEPRIVTGHVVRLTALDSSVWSHRIGVRFDRPATEYEDDIRALADEPGDDL